MNETIAFARLAYMNKQKDFLPQDSFSAPFKFKNKLISINEESPDT